MNESFVEVKSALWQKLLATIFLLPFAGLGIFCWLSIFLPLVLSKEMDRTTEFVYGLFFLTFACVSWWFVVSYSIRADEIGISQKNGFLHQVVQWNEVKSYYVEVNTRAQGDKNYVEPVLLDANDQIVFRSFLPVFRAVPDDLKRRRALWDYVEAHLVGKKIEATSADFDPDVIAHNIIQAEQSARGSLWLFGHLLGLAIQTAAIFSLSFALLLYYLVSRRSTVPQPWAILLAVPMMMAPVGVLALRSYFKKKKVLRELQLREAEK